MVLANEHPLILKGLELAMGQVEGATVVGLARDGQEAVDQCLELKPDYCWLDLTLPVLNGLDATRRILAKAKTQVLMTSLHRDQANIREAMRRGVRAFVYRTEPFANYPEIFKNVEQGKLYMSQELTAEVCRIAIDNPGQAEAPALTLREGQILQLVAEGRTSRDIGDTLGIAKVTVDRHRNNILNKFGVHSWREMVRRAKSLGLITPVAEDQRP